jgi:6-phosphofructokinase
MDEKLAILVGGGPAPGINGVIEASVREAASRGIEVIGIIEGFKWLSQGDTRHTRVLSENDVYGIHYKGGSIVRTSRDNPTKSPEKMNNIIRALDALKVKYLLTIGGDDTSFSARRVSDVAQGRISVVHVPKTIDNDLPLPLGVPTFGYETARQLGAALVGNLLEDARASTRWYFVIAMGRAAGFLGLGMFMSSGASVALIPEEFPHGTSFQRVVDIIETSVIKRLILNKDYGVAIISEGVAERLNPDEFAFIKDIGRDEHGNLKLADAPLGTLLKEEVGKRLKDKGIKMKIIEKDIGFELRSSAPNAFDREYTKNLGISAVRFLYEGGTEAMMTFYEGMSRGVPFSEIMNPETGRTQTRTVDVTSDYYINAMSAMDRLKDDDFKNGQRCKALAAVTGMSEKEFIDRFSYLI